MAEYLDPGKLWEVMKGRNISPQDLIESLGVESRTIGKWLTGEASPRAGSMFQLARALGVKKEDIVSEYAE